MYGAPQVLYATFASPWAEEPATPEPQFTLPSCYYLQPPPLKPMHLKNFQLETLFYIFYAMPQDVLQARLSAVFDVILLLAIVAFCCGMYINTARTGL